MKYLMVTHAFPPFGGGGVQRMTKFAIYLKEYGWEPKVIAPGEHKDSWIDQNRLSEIGDIQIIRTGIRSLGHISIWKKIIRKSFPVDFYYPWAKQAFSCAEKHRFDTNLIFTSGPPHSVHLTGLWMAEKYKLPWVADFRDHFTLGPEYKPFIIKGKVDRYYEKKFLQKASSIILNTETNKEELLKAFPDLNPEKCHVIYNGFDRQDLVIDPSVVTPFEKEKVNYLYLGGLRGDHIDGYFYRMLYEVLAIRPELKDQIRIYIVGDISRKGSLAEDLGLQSCIQFMNPVAFNKVGVFLRDCDACLTWQRPNPRYRGTIAGKLFDYIGMGKPVFSLGQPDGEIARILQITGLGKSEDPADAKLAARSFLEFHEQLKKGAYKLTPEKSVFIANFERKFQSEKLASIFDSLCSETGKRETE